MTNTAEITILEDSDVEHEWQNLSVKVQKRKPGSAKGLFTISDVFHEPLNEEELKKLV